MKLKLLIATFTLVLSQAFASTSTVILEKGINLNEKSELGYPYSVRLGFMEGNDPFELEDEGAMVIDGCTLIIRSHKKTVTASSYKVTEVKTTRPKPFDVMDTSRWGKIIFSENESTQVDIKCFADNSFRFKNPYSNNKMNDILNGYVILD